MIKNFKYYASGLPKMPTDPVYALYQPILDRFLVIVDSAELAQQLSSLLITRYSTYVCRVDQAVNYTHNIIDNEVCNHWTFNNIQDAPADMLLYNHDPVKANKLIPTTNTVAWNVDKEKEWILFCRHWLVFFKLLKQHFYNYYTVDEFLSDFLPADNLEYYTRNIERQVLSLLFFGQDIDLVNAEILKVLKTNPIINLAVDSINTL